MMTFRSKSILIISLLVLSVANTGIYAQTSSDWEWMLVREDKVNPSQTWSYETALGDMKYFLEENKVTNVSYFTHLRDDYTYIHVTPIANLEDLDKGVLAYLKSKADKPGINEAMNNVYGSIYSYKYSLLKYSASLSYVPEGNNWGSSSTYRKWSYYYFKPGTEEETEKILSAWKQLYKTKGVKNGYRIFAGSIGLDNSLYIFSTWAKDPMTLQTELQANMALLGTEGAALWAKTMENVQRVDTYEGWYLPQYSYTQGKKFAEAK